MTEKLRNDGLSKQWRNLIERFVDSMGMEGARQFEVPPDPQLGGLPHAVAEQVRAQLQGSQMRRLLHAFVRSYGWEWRDVDG